MIASVLWIALVWRVGRSMRRAITDWAAGAWCLLLAQGNRMTQLAEDETEWKQIWEGGRSSDKNERFRLYQKRVGSR